MSMSEPRINTVLSGDTPLIQDKHNFLISTFCSFTLPRHTCTTEAIWFILGLYLMSCEFTHLFTKQTVLPSVRLRAQDHSKSPSPPDHIDYLESCPNLLYFKPPESISSKVTKDSQRISGYDSKFESNPN